MKSKIRGLPIDKLWELHKFTRDELISKLKLQMKEISGRLDELESSKSDPINLPSLPGNLLSLPAGSLRPERKRRPYAKPEPKFQNPENPSETWTGRGLRPRWLTAQVKAGKKIEDFRIVPMKAAGMRKQAR